MNDYVENYEALSAAIIQLAAEDYKKAYKHRNSRARNTRDKARADLKTLERFFTGEWFALLVDMDGRYIMERIRKEVDKWELHYEPQELTRV